MKLKLILIFMAFLPMAVQATTITVGPSGFDYANIQEAVDAADPGDVIEVQAGTYYENVNVTKPLALIGIGMPMVDAQHNGSAIRLSSDGVLLAGLVAANSGFVASNSGFPEVNSNSLNVAGILVRSNNNTLLHNNPCHNNMSAGIDLRYTDNNTLTGNFASYNGYGIYLWNSKNNIIDDNVCEENLLAGIDLWYSNNNRLSRNSVFQSRYGISLSYSDDNALSNNSARNNLIGINLRSSDGNTFAGNNACDNEGGAEFFDSENNRLHQNYLTNNSKSDVSDEEGANQWFVGTVGNYYGGFDCADADGDRICDSVYEIPGGSGVDRYPLAEPFYVRSVYSC